MARALCLAMTILLPLSASSDTSPNAALKYWQAFAAIPSFTAVERARLMIDCLTMPLDAQAREYITQAGYALRMMRRGAAAQRCDWCIGWEDEGLKTLLPHVDAAKLLSSLACLRARVRFEEGHNTEAIEDILAAITLSRHVSQDGSLPSILAAHAIERRISQTLGFYLPSLPAEVIRNLKQRWECLPPRGSLATGVREEQALEMSWLIRKVKEANNKESLLALLSQLWHSEDEGRALFEDCGGTPANVLKHAEELRSWYALLAKQMELPLDQFEKQQEREAMRLAANPMYKRFAPAIIRCRWLQAEADVRHNLMSAAIAVQLGGREALQQYPDAMVGGSYEYVAFEGGFELRSKWTLDQKVRSRWRLGLAESLALTVGGRQDRPRPQVERTEKSARRENDGQVLRPSL